MTRHMSGQFWSAPQTNSKTILKHKTGILDQDIGRGRQIIDMLYNLIYVWPGIIEKGNKKPTIKTLGWIEMAIFLILKQKPKTSDPRLCTWKKFT